MPAEDILAVLAALRRLKGEIAPFVRGLKISNQTISSLDGDERMTILDCKWRMDAATAVLEDPTSTHADMSAAFKTVAACIKTLYRKSLEWEDADTERSAQALEEIASAVGSRLFSFPFPSGEQQPGS